MMRHLVAVALFAAAPPALAQPIFEARSEHFRVTSVVSAESASQAAAVLERFRRLCLEAGLGRPRHRSHPVEAFVLRNAIELAVLDPTLHPDSPRSRGLSAAAPERHYLAVAWHAPGDPLVALGHEYAHLIERAGQGPAWFREGFAEYVALLEQSPGYGFVSRPTAGHLHTLATAAWIPLQELLSAQRRSQAFRERTFYAQSWLLFHWLASQEPDFRDLSPASVGRWTDALGAAELMRQLRTYAASLEARETGTSGALRAEPLPAVRVIEPWRFTLRRASVWRELQQWERAEAALAPLVAQHPSEPGPAESLGALRMDRGRYDEAERLLSIAVANGSRNARTHYRYSLLLLRPVEHPWAGRAEVALLHARHAAKLDPAEPLYRFTEAQALMNAGKWAEAAARLHELLGVAEWRQRAEQEYAELQRRRTQELSASEPPRLPPQPDSGAALAAWLEVEPPAVARPARRERKQAAELWPPPGTILLYGRIASVECRPTERIITVDTPRFRVRLRERAGSPATLYHPPRRWEHVPCGSRGWVVNVAYRPGGEGSIDGEVVAVVF